MAEIVRIADPAQPAGTPSLPANIEAEAALLGALMLDNRLVEDVGLKLKPDHFHESLHGRIYEAILKLTDKNMVANPVTLRPMFEGDEAMKEVGGAGYLATLTGSGATLIAARDFAQQIYDLALLRALIGVGRDLVESALDTSEEVAPTARRSRSPKPPRRLSRPPRGRSTAAAIFRESPPASKASTARSADSTTATW
jgi:replicative DNA helicase